MQYAWIRYSDDGGQTFTVARQWEETGEYGGGRNIWRDAWLLGSAYPSPFTREAPGVITIPEPRTTPVEWLATSAWRTVPATGTVRQSIVIETDAPISQVVRITFISRNAAGVTSSHVWKIATVETLGDNLYRLTASHTFTEEGRRLRMGDILLTDPQLTRVRFVSIMVTMGDEVYPYAPAPEDQLFGTTPGAYIGTAVWDKPYPPTSVDAYEWVQRRVKEDNATGVETKRYTSTVAKREARPRSKRLRAQGHSGLKVGGSRTTIHEGVTLSGETLADLDIADEAGNVVLRVSGGHVQAGAFDSIRTAEVLDNDLDAGDLDIADERGQVAARISGGHIQTGAFDSRKAVTASDGGSGDLDIADEAGNVVLRVSGGHVQTGAFDSRTGAGAVATNNSDEADLALCDEAGNAVALFANGHVRTRYFDSANASSGGGASGGVAARKRLRLLVYGNSWSQQAMSYVPGVIKSILGDEIDLLVGVMYVGGASLAQQLERMNGGRSDYELHIWTDGASAWATSYSQSFHAPLSRYDWDLVAFQPSPWEYSTEAAYQPLGPLMEGIAKVLRTPVRFGMLMGPSLPEGYTPSGGTSVEIFATMQRLRKRYPLAFMLPTGTAIENARTTSLRSLGSYGQMCHGDGLHINEGLPYLIEAYAAALVLMQLAGFGHRGVVGSDWRPTGAATIWNSFYGGFVGLDDASIRLAQRIAEVAAANPYEIIDCSNL